MTVIKVFNNEILLGSFKMIIPEYQPVPYWYRDIQFMIMARANERFGIDWTHTKLEDAAE